jgi:predicted lipoprotein
MSKTPTNSPLRTELEKHFQIHWVRGAACGVALALLGCAPVPLSDGERRVALRGTTERVIVPTYTELAERARDLAERLDELAAAPGLDELQGARESYRAVRAPLGEAAALDFGPAEELHASAALDQSPIDTAKLEVELAANTEITAESVRLLGANKRGLHAIEYLLFPDDDAELEASLLADDEAGQRRRAFASAAASVVVQNAEALLEAWAQGEGDYARRFSEPGAPDSVSPGVQAGLDTLLNQTVVLSEVLANVKLGKPLGVTTGTGVDVEAQESARAGASLSDMRANLRGIQNVYFGARGAESEPSLSTLVRAKSPSADRNCRAALRAAEAALEAVPEPFSTALTDAPERVRAAYDAIKDLKRVLATEVLGSLGASLKFSDNDGD